MNLRNKIMVTLFALGTIFMGSCDSLIYDNLEDCPQGVYVKFYSMTPCESDSTFIGNVPLLTVFAFDENDRLVTSVTHQNVTLSRDYEVLMPVSDGNFTFVAWAGVNDKFTLGSFTSGTTTKKEVMLTLKSASGIAERLNGVQIWHGESPIVFLPDPVEYGSLYKHTAVNLKELTNRIELIVEFDEATMKDYDPEALHAEVSSANGKVRIDGTMPLDEPVLTYPAIETNYEENAATWNYSLLALETGYSNNLHIYYTGNDEEGETVFDGDLIATILLRAVEKGVNLHCENNFTIKFLIKNYCVECWTHFSCAIYVNDWLVHSYETDMGI